jgi:periplasmic protein TonB
LWQVVIESSRGPHAGVTPSTENAHQRFTRASRRRNLALTRRRYRGVERSESASALVNEPGGFMLGVLLESRARRQRRFGGAALSVAAHLTIVGAVAAGTMRHVGRSPDRPKAVIISFHLPPRPIPTDRSPTARGRPSPWMESPILPRIAISNLAPKSLPPISFGVAAPPNDLAFGAASPASGSGSPLGILDGATGDEMEPPWTGRELMMRLLATSKPRYPESLRGAGVEGKVLIRFVVDTAGRIEPSSVQVLSATHPLFVQAVKAALGGFRFRPAEVAGRRVEATAEMPFEFSISRAR